jgi:Protein of unknown function (DUF3574)
MNVLKGRQTVMRGWVFLPMTVCATLIVGCATLSKPAGGTSAEPLSPATGCGAVRGSALWARTELYFGMQKADNSFTSNDEYQSFLDKEVTPRFKDGFSVLEGRGQYLGPNGRLWREPNKILVLMYPADPSKSTAIEEIRSAYKSAFHQESVMRVDGSVCVAF